MLNNKAIQYTKRRIVTWREFPLISGKRCRLNPYSKPQTTECMKNKPEAPTVSRTDLREAANTMLNVHHETEAKATPTSRLRQGRISTK